MTARIRRIGQSRFGILGLVLLVLLVVIVAHLLVMGIHHGDQDACATCAVTLVVGITLALAALARHAEDPKSGSHRIVWRIAAVPAATGWNATPRGVVLRL
jgi:hypothetical protein